MADNATASIAACINKMGIKITALARGTGIPDGILRRSIVRQERDLRSDEFLSICKFLNKNPFEFYQGADSAQDSA